jgi:hypothetical protein
VFIEAAPRRFGRLAFFAACRDRGSGVYREAEALRDYDAAELSVTLTALHAKGFREWLGMNLEQQSRDLARYLSTPGGRAAFLPRFLPLDLLGGAPTELTRAFEARTGQAVALEVKAMAIAAGISRDTAHRLLRSAGSLSFREKHRLDVLPTHVVNAADWRSASECAVWSRGVVGA